MSDPGHYWSNAEWAKVQADAAEWRSRRSIVATAGEVITGTINAAQHGGSRTHVAFGVLHSAETPLQAGYAYSIAKMFSTTATAKSATYMVDPVATYRCLSDLTVPWHVGNGNTWSVGVEQAGYAAYSTAQWTSADGMAQMRRIAALIKQINATHGLGAYWMSDAQLLGAHRNGTKGGWATHDQCRRVLGGTTHTDPMPNYPLAQLMALVNGSPSEDDLDANQANQLQAIFDAMFKGGTSMPDGKALPQLTADARDAIQNTLQNATGGDLRLIVSMLRALPAPTPPVAVDAAALAAALLADDAAVKKLGDAIAAGLAGRVANG